MLIVSGICTVFLLLLQLWTRDASATSMACTEDQLTGCVKRFQVYLDSGVEVLKDSNDTFIGKVCGMYLLTSECISIFMYYCPAFKRQLHDKVKQFEYACNAEDHAGNWPYMPTVSPAGKDRVDEELAAIEREKLVQSAIKASLAAAVTVVLILICVMADCISKWRIRQRIKKAAAAAASQGEQPLLKNADIEDGVEATSTEAITKKA